MEFGARQKQALVVLLLMIAGIWYASVRQGPQSPEAQMTAVVDELIQAAEDKDLDPFKKHLSDEFRDERGRDKNHALNIVRMIFLRHPRISLARISLEFMDMQSPDVRDAHLVVLGSETRLPSDRFEFWITFRLEAGAWRIWEAKWGDGYGV